MDDEDRRDRHEAGAPSLERRPTVVFIRDLVRFVAIPTQITVVHEITHECEPHETDRTHEDSCHTHVHQEFPGEDPVTDRCPEHEVLRGFVQG